MGARVIDKWRKLNRSGENEIVFGIDIYKSRLVSYVRKLNKIVIYGESEVFFKFNIIYKLKRV